MIWIFHRERADAGSCENYDDLFQYINLKLLQGYPEPQQIPWSFTFFTHQEVSVIYENTKQSLLTEIVKEAYIKEIGFIAICQEGFGEPLEILNTPDIDKQALKKQWCLAYCEAHGYIVVDNDFCPQYPQQEIQWQPEAEQFSNYLQLSQE